MQITSNRRSFMAGVSLSGIAMLSGCATTGQPKSSFFERTGLPIGLQVYTLGNEAGKDLDATFAAIAAIGYRAIELPNLYGRSPAQVRAAADRAGLKITSLHTPLIAMGGMGGLTFATDPSELADGLASLGTNWAVAPICQIPATFRPQSGESFGVTIARAVAAAGADHWKQTAALLNSKAAALKPLGVKVAYHNHNIEFAPIGSTTGWDILWQETDPALVHFEVDTGWVSTAGLDPVAFLERAKGRVSLLHVKDVAANNVKSFAISMSPAEVGSGVLPFERILPAAHVAGVRHFLVEQEPPFVIERIEAARKSFAYLAGLRA